MNHELDGGRDGMNPLAATRGDKSPMQTFARLLWTLVFFLSVKL